MKDIEIKVKNFINKNTLLDKTGKVYVATSGGADSMALLAFMNSHKSTFNIEVGAVHVNHGIRGETARRDAKFVRDYCNLHNIEYILFDAEKDNVYVPDNASEEWARQLRYNYFNSLCKEGIKIATAHTLSDQTETVLFRMARGGSGLKGLTGIPVNRDNYIRPFLCLTRVEIEQLVDYYKTGNITDETNLGDYYSRNKIRHYVVPMLKEINENAEKSISKVCERISKAQAYIEKQAKTQLDSCEVINGLVYKTDGFIGIDEIIIDEMILQLLGKIKYQDEHYVEVIKNFLDRRTNTNTSEIVLGELPITDELSIMVTSEYITVKNSYENRDRSVYVGINTFGVYNHNLTIKQHSYESFRSVCETKNQLCNFADMDKIDITKCVMRSRKDGDTFKPACRMGGKLVRYMRNIPLAQREAVPVIEYNGEIIWVWGVGFTDGYTPTENSSNIHEFMWK